LGVAREDAFISGHRIDHWLKPPGSSVAAPGVAVRAEDGTSHYRRIIELNFTNLLRILFIVLVSFLLAGIGLAVEIELPPTDPQSPIAISAEQASTWREGQYDVLLLSGQVQLRQGLRRVQASDAVLWVLRSASPDEPSRVIAWLEGEVRIDDGGQSYRDAQWFGRFETGRGVELNLPPPQPEPAIRPPIYRRAANARGIEAVPDKNVKPAQFMQPLPPLGSNAAPTEPRDPLAGLARAGIKRVQIFPRSSVRWQARSEMNPNNPAEQITTINSGVQVVVDTDGEFGTVTIETDRAVVWSPPVNVMGASQDKPLQAQGPIELYLEGNIVFRQGDRLIYAERMYYNATQEHGVVLAAEMLTPVKDYRGLVRLKADVLQQVDKQNFQAYGAAVTTSRLGVPRYWLQSERITFEDRQTLAPTPYRGEVPVDPATGEPAVEHDLLATSRNNFLYLGQVPVFYWPFLASNLRKPTFYVNGATVKSDTIFGQQVFVDYDAWQLLGMDPIAGTDWSISSDYLSERGPAGGTRFEYNRPGFLMFPGPTIGFIDAWGVYDQGTGDVLGRDRLSVPIPREERGRLLARHRQELPNAWRFSGEIGLISDRNFLEQYFEREWDQQKDYTTGFELKKFLENGTFSISADFRPNSSFTETEHLPRLDHFVLGQDLAGGWLTWNAHSLVGYEHLRTASPPPPGDVPDLQTFQLLPWEQESEGLRAITRQSLDLPLQAGPVKVVPYVLGEVGFWGEDLTGDSTSRAYGQAGVRASLPMWRVDPNVRSELFNLNGLAHKIVWEADAFYADASQDLGRFPLYDQLDDNSQEQVRRRSLFRTFGGTFGDQIPLKYDERNFAFRSGMQDWVTAQSPEIVDDLTVVRLGMRNRWQTKRGPAGRETIIDWMELDLGTSLFPDADRDNFGEVAGLANYDFKWHLGDRFTLMSDGFADVFDQGLRQVSVGGNLGRPESGSLYLGARSTEGPISSSVLLAYLNYRMSEKWIANAGMTYDLSSTGNIGNTVGFTRIGEAFLLSMNANYDASRQALGVNFSIEPRFLPRGRAGFVNGVRVPPAGTYGVE
jgi:lipopolysaccharide export system protein LptA